MESNTHIMKHSSASYLSPLPVTATVCSWQSFACFIMKPIMKATNRGVTFQFAPADLDPNACYIVASNHQSQLDAFVMLAAFANAQFGKLSPFRAMTMNRYLMSGPVKYAALHMGCYPAKRHPTLPSGIECAAELLRSGQTVFICPEGDLTLPGQRPARPGVAVLAKLPNVMVIPAHIQWTRYGRIRRSFKLTYGKPVDASGMTAQQILDACYALPLR